MPANLTGSWPSLSADDQQIWYTANGCQPGCLVRTKRASAIAWGAPEAVVVPGGLIYNQVDVSPTGLELLMTGPGSTGANALVVATRPNTDTLTFTNVYTIPALSFVSTYNGASWSADGRTIYLTVDHNPTGVGGKDIVMSVLQ